MIGQEQTQWQTFAIICLDIVHHQQFMAGLLTIMEEDNRELA
jgi:hypothetical protein